MPSTQTDPQARATVIGTGLIGGSVGLALRKAGWHVSGADTDPDRLAQAQAIGAIDSTGIDPSSQITFVATAVSQIHEAVAEALAATSGWITDVGSVKAPLLAAMNDPRFVGGHPMAGSEQEGIAGARADMFEGAIWVLTPTPATSDDAYMSVRSAIASMGAEIVTLPPERHDELVALISHVPHLTAATLMLLAEEHSEQRQQLQRLAAGGFRDMTRIAAGHPGIWPDICIENSDAICEGLDSLIAALGKVRNAVAQADRAHLMDHLSQARSARLNLPGTVGAADELVELRVVIADRPGEIARLTAIASDLQVNIRDLEIAHSPEGERGVLVMLVDADEAAKLRQQLEEAGDRCAIRPVER